MFRNNKIERDQIESKQSRHWSKLIFSIRNKQHKGKYKPFHQSTSEKLVDCLKFELQHLMESFHQGYQVLHPEQNTIVSKISCSLIGMKEQLTTSTWFELRDWITDLICSVICSSSLSINSDCSYLHMKVLETKNDRMHQQWR